MTGFEPRYRKQPLYQLSHNHCQTLPSYFFVFRNCFFCTFPIDRAAFKLNNFKGKAEISDEFYFLMIKDINRDNLTFEGSTGKNKIVYNFKSDETFLFNSSSSDLVCKIESDFPIGNRPWSVLGKNTTIQLKLSNVSLFNFLIFVDSCD